MTRENRDRQIIERVQAGELQKDIASDMGLSTAKVWRICMKAGLSGKQMKKERNRKILERVANGETRAAVSREFGLSVNMVSRICRNEGVVAWKRLTKQEYQKRNHKIIERVQAGENQTAVGKEFGLTGVQVGVICKQAGRRVRPRFSGT